VSSRAAKLKKDKLEKILGVALSPENLSAQVGYPSSTSAPPSARGDKNMLAVSSKDIRERERARSTTAVAPVNASASGAPTTATKRRQSSTERSTRRESNLISPRPEAGVDQRSHLHTATVPGSHKQKLVHKRLKLQKLLGAHLSSEAMMSQVPSTSSDALIDVEQQLLQRTTDATDELPSPSSMRKKWWSSSSKRDEGEAGTGGAVGGAEVAAMAVESCGNDPPSSPREEGTKRHRHKPSTPERRKERGERRKSFIPWINNNSNGHQTMPLPFGGSDDETDASGGGGGGEQQQQQGEVVKPQKRKKEGAFTGFFRRKNDTTTSTISSSSTSSSPADSTPKAESLTG
jgi:hypothetical protein